MQGTEESRFSGDQRRVLRPPTLYQPVSEVDDLVEEESPSGGAGEPRRDELVPVRQEGVALRAREQPLPTDVLQVDTTHLALLLSQIEVLSEVVCGLLQRFFRIFSSVRPFYVVFMQFSSISASAELEYF